jgi:hypothetical protein
MTTENRLAGIRHPAFGALSVPPAPGTVFDPLPLFLDPQRLPMLLKYWERRAARFGVGDGLSRKLKRAAIEQAGQDALQVFLDRDYEAAKITADDVTRAILGTARYMDRAGWRISQVGDGARRRDARKWFPLNRAENARTPNPAAIVAASYNAAEDREALMGAGDDLPGVPVAVTGGKRRAPGHGKMVRTVKVLRDWVERDAAGELQEMAEIETGWRMDRRRGCEQDYPACVVTDGRKMPKPHHTPTATPAAAGASEAGERSMIPHYAPDAESYRAALREYYASR